MKRLALGLLLATAGATVANAQGSIDFSTRSGGTSISIHLSSYPRLVTVPGYPVYYAPQARANYFFYDGIYWVYESDNWYASDWYNGPWDRVDPYDVPAFLLRIPVRYYRAPPAYFKGWRADASPRWDEHYGRDWNSRRAGWDKWDRRSAATPAPLPTYQRRYKGERYPQQTQQRDSIRSGQYRYAPRDPDTRQYLQKREPPGQPRDDNRRNDDRRNDQGNDRGNKDRDDRGKDRH